MKRFNIVLALCMSSLPVLAAENVAGVYLNEDGGQRIEVTPVESGLYDIRVIAGGGHCAGRLIEHGKGKLKGDKLSFDYLYAGNKGDRCTGALRWFSSDRDGACSGTPDKSAPRVCVELSDSCTTVENDEKNANLCAVLGVYRKKTSLCERDEKTVFSCNLGRKMVSVCASPDVSPTRGYLQYRFGQIDGFEPEMSVPKEKTAADRQLDGAHIGYVGANDMNYWRFKNGEYSYVVYSATVNNRDICIACTVCPAKLRISQRFDG